MGLLFVFLAIAVIILPFSDGRPRDSSQNANGGDRRSRGNDDRPSKPSPRNNRQEPMGPATRNEIMHPYPSEYHMSPSTEFFDYFKSKRESGDFVVKKTQFNPKTRLLLVAGLEGSGHHAMHAMFSICERRKLCEPEPAVTHLTITLDHATRQVHGLFSGSDSNSSITDIKKMFPLLQQLPRVKGNHLYMLGLSFTPHSAMLSYPNYNGPNKPLDHPDIYAMAMLAESAGVDFRVLVLQRSGPEMLASTQSREMGANLEPKVLVNNAEALHGQLALIDRKFYHCVRYKKLGSFTKDEKNEFVQFIHPQLMSVVEEMFEQIEFSKPKTVNNTEVVTKDDYYGFLIDSRLSMIDQLCES